MSFSDNRLLWWSWDIFSLTLSVFFDRCYDELFVGTKYDRSIYPGRFSSERYIGRILWSFSVCIGWQILCCILMQLFNILVMLEKIHTTYLQGLSWMLVRKTTVTRRNNWIACHSIQERQHVSITTTCTFCCFSFGDGWHRNKSWSSDLYIWKLGTCDSCWTLSSRCHIMIQCILSWKAVSSKQCYCYSLFTSEWHFTVDQLWHG